MWAARPHLGSIFEKLLHRKTFCSPAARCLQLCDFDTVFHVKRSELLLEKTVCNIRQKGVPPLLLPASVQQLPRCLVRIYNLFHKDNSIANWQVSKNAIAAGKQTAKLNLLRKCGLLAHTSAAFLKNCCTEKLFCCLRLLVCSQDCFILMLCFT